MIPSILVDINDLLLIHIGYQTNYVGDQAEYTSDYYWTREVVCANTVANHPAALRLPIMPANTWMTVWRTINAKLPAAVVCMAAGNGDLSSIMFLCDYNPSHFLNIFHIVISQAATNHHLSIVRYLVNHATGDFSSNLLETVSHLPSFLYVMMLNAKTVAGLSMPQQDSIVERVLGECNLATWLYIQHHVDEINMEIKMSVIANGHLCLIKSLLMRGKYSEFILNFVKVAVRRSQFAILRHLIRDPIIIGKKDIYCTICSLSAVDRRKHEVTTSNPSVKAAYNALRYTYMW